MPTRNEAIIKSELLVWAREATRTSVEEASSATSVSPDRILEWESGQSRPTVRQLRLLATKYRLPFAAFYLPEPPELKLPRLRDYRSLSVRDPLEDRTLLLEIRRTMEVSSIAADLSEESSEASHSLPEIKMEGVVALEIASLIRVYLELDLAQQQEWTNERVAFNALRNKAETAGLLVLQTSKVPIEQFRALSLPEAPIPVILLNRKDAYAGRTFSILHEIAHLMLRTPAICSMQPESILDHANRHVEVLCNAAASEAIVPTDDLRAQLLGVASGSTDWSDSVLRSLARRYGCSREVILRRILDMGLTTQEFYEEERLRFSEEFSRRQSSGARVPPPVDALSLLGRRYVATVLAALDRGDITHNDFSDFTELRLKHIDDLRARL